MKPAGHDRDHIILLDSFGAVSFMNI